jgi:hypothetical protein
VVGALVIGALLGLIVCWMMIGFEQGFVDIDGRLKGGRRAAPLVLPILVGVAAAWSGMRILERISGIAGSAMIFVLAILGGGVAFGLAVGLSMGQLERMTTEQAMIIAGLASLGFVVTATGMAYMDE